MDAFLLFAGFVLLVVGGEFLVRGAVSLAIAFRVSPMVIGLTLVGFGTSTPELLTSVQAALAGSPGIAVGNVVGSNIANILLIIGIAALINPLTVSSAAFRRDGTVMVLATAICVVAALLGALDRIAGALFVAALAAYVWVTIWIERRRGTAAASVYEAEAETLPAAPLGLGRSAALVAAGLVLTIVGARLLVDGAIGIAAALGVSEAVIGLTIVAVGTSLPELVTSVVAALKRQSDVAVGNIIGSNIFNILGILGATALVQPIEVPPVIAQFDVWVMVAATLALVVVARSGWRISRLEGALLLGAYAGYLIVLAVGSV